MKITELLQINEMKNEFGEVIYSSFGTWKKAAKTANPDVWFDGDADICNAMVGPKPYKRLETRAIGEWDGEQGVVFKSSVNEQQDVVHFYVDSERAYDAIIKKFGYTIDQDEDSGLMTAPREHWAAIEQLAHDAGGSAEEEDYGLGSPEHYSVREQKAGTKFKSGDKVTIKNAKKYDSMAPTGVVSGVVDFVWPDGRVAVKVKVGASAGQMNVDASDLVQEGVAGNYAEQLAHEVFDLDPNMDTSGNAGKLLKYAYSVAEKELGADRAKGFFRDGDFLGDFVSTYHALQKQGVAESSGGNYAEQLAHQVFDHNPNLDASGSADELLKVAYLIAKKELGSRAEGFFRDEDFPSDFASAYHALQKHGGAESSEQAWEVSFSDGADVIKVHASSKQEAIYKATQIAKSMGNLYPSVDWARHKEQGVAEGRDELQAELKTINQQLKDAFKEYKKNHQMHPDQYMKKVKELKDRGEELIKQLQHGMAEGTAMLWNVYCQTTTTYASGENDYETELVKTFNNEREAENYAYKLNVTNRYADDYYYVRGNKHGMAEGLSKRDQQDVAAIKAAIERLQAQLQQPNADRAAIQASIAHEKKRLALYGQDMAEDSVYATDSKMLGGRPDLPVTIHKSPYEGAEVGEYTEMFHASPKTAQQFAKYIILKGGSARIGKRAQDMYVYHKGAGPITKRDFRMSKIEEGTGDPEEGWCVVSSDRPRIVIDGPHLDREEALEYKRSVPPAQSSRWLVLWGKEASDGSGEYVATRAVNPAEEVKEGFSEDDLAVGGTIIYKANDQYRMSVLVTKLVGRKLKLMNGATCDLADVVSTDKSDWPRFRDMKVASGIKYPTEKIAEAPLRPSYKQQFAKWGVVPKSKKMFVTFFKPGEEQHAKDFAEKTDGRLIKVDQAGREIKEAHELGLDPDKRVVIKGVRGMKSTPFSKKFKNLAAYEAWLDSDEAGDYEIYGVMNESAVQQEAAYADNLDSDKPIIVKGFRGMHSRPFKKRFKNMAAYEAWLEYDGDDVQPDSLEVTNESTVQQEAFDTPEFASHHEEAMFHLSQANDASAAGNSDAYHMHMLGYHESMTDHAMDKGNSAAVDYHTERAGHHESEVPVEPADTEDVAPVKENKKELQLPILVSASAKFTLMYHEANFILRSNGKRLAKMTAQSWQYMLDAVKNRTSATTEEGYSISLNGDSYAIADSTGTVLAQLTAADMDKLVTDSNIFLDTAAGAQ